MDEINIIKYDFSDYVYLNKLKKLNKPNNLDVITKDDKCVGGIRYYNIGLEQDPIIGTKTAKGDHYLISPIWMEALAIFITNNIDKIQQYIKEASEEENDYLYFVNASRNIFNKALISAFKTEQSIDNLLMATWLIMCASEIDNFPFTKYTKEERYEHKLNFYKKFLSKIEIKNNNIPRYDLLPSIVLERFAINNELAKLKYEDPEFELKDGFVMSKRVNSLLRHFISIYENKTNEDHIINALYCFHAIYCNIKLFPHMNDLTNYEEKINKN